MQMETRLATGDEKTLREGLGDLVVYEGAGEHDEETTSN